MQKRTLYYDRLRILSAVAVVVIHICGVELFRHAVGSRAWAMYNILDSFSRFAVPLFIMLSGALFLNPEKEVKVKKLYSKNLMRIAVAFFFWSVVYALINYNGDVFSFLKSILLGHFHMYFLFIIAALYIAVPIYRKICEDGKIMRYFLMLCIVFTFLLPLMSKFPHMSVIETMLDKANFRLVAGYSVYFVGGYYFSSVELSKKRRTIIYVFGVLAFLSTALFTHVASINAGKLYDGYYSAFSGNVLIQASSLFVFAKHNLAFTPRSKVQQKVLSLFSRLTFGIYLSHMLVLYALDAFDVVDWMASVPLYVSSKLVLTLLISGVLSYLLGKIPVLKKYIV